MHLEKYQYQAYKTHLEYEFYSYGPKGRIKKVVRFQPDFLNGILYYNLAFGDLHEDGQTMNDLVQSNNADTEKVLGTVAAIVLEFTSHFPSVLVYAEGSTLSRARRYQMGISRLWDEIELVFNVYGVRLDGTFESYQKNVNYRAFWIRRK
jgi:hypothetical protein